MATAFTSIHHPGEAPAGLVIARALVAPLGACMLPVMLGATAAALQQAPVLPFLTWGMPAALGVASLWTRFQLGATPAEVHIRAHEAAVRSVHDCLAGAAPDWQWIHEIRQGSEVLIVTIGFETHRLRYADWPDYPALLDALRAARAAADASHPQSTASHA